MKAVTQAGDDELKRRFLKLADVLEIAKIKRATLYRWIADGRFPRQIPLSEKHVIWLRSDVEKWADNIASRSL